MAVPPRLPTSLDAKDMAWVRWVTKKLQDHELAQSKAASNTVAATQQRATAQATTAVHHEASLAQQALTPLAPTAPPQQPTMPTLYTDHGTVTIRWDGKMHANLTYVPLDGDDSGPSVDPARGFLHVNAFRAESVDGPWTAVGGTMGQTGSIVDTEVVVGKTYFYYLITTDSAGGKSDPSPIASVKVKGVDLGTLDQDVKDALTAAQGAAAAGADAAAAGAAAAQAAQDAASSAAMQAALALKNANTAMTSVDSKSRVIYSINPPVATSSDGDNGDGTFTRSDFTDNGDGTWTATSLITDNGDGTWTADSVAAGGISGDFSNGDVWFQLDANGVIIAQWQYNGTTWISNNISGGIIGTGINAGNITVGTLNSNRIGANSISANQMIAGTITAASGVLADAVITNAKIADLAVNTAKIADLAVNNAKINDLDGNKIQAATIVAGKLSADSVTTNNIIAGAIDTNRIQAGAISADKLSIRTLAQTTNTTNRIPAPLTDSTWWNMAIANYVPQSDGTVGSWTHPNENVTAQTWGLVYSSSATLRAIMGLMPMAPVPQSRKITIHWVASAPIIVQVREMQGTNTNWVGVANAANGTVTVTMDSTITHYGVYMSINSGSGQVSVSECQVFEVIGGDANGQSAQLSPAGLQLFSGGNPTEPVVDLTTNASQVLQVNDSSGTEPQTVAAIGKDGSAAFQGQVTSATGFDIKGVYLTDLDAPDSLYSAAPNGSSWSDDVPLLDRLARGPIYDVRWDTMANYKSSAQYIRIAEDQFTLEDGRQYMIVCNLGGLQADLTSAGDPASTGQQAIGVNVYCEMQINAAPNSNIRDGAFLMRSIVYNNQRGYWNFYPVIVTASSAVDYASFAHDSAYAQSMLEQRLVPANNPLYWQVNFNMSSAPARQLSVTEFGGNRGVTVIDLGSSNITRPSGNDSLAPTTNRTTESGGSNSGSTGSTSGGTTATSKTVTFTAKDSRTFNNGGSTQVTGTGQFTNGDAMYYGTGASDMGSWFGQFRDSSNRSLNSVVGGKTVTAATLTVKNTYCYSTSGADVRFGTASSDTALGSIGAPTNNVWSTHFNPGTSKSMTLSSAIRAGLKDGSVKSFVLGVGSGHAGVYSYFRGANQSSPPKLSVTYH